MRLVIHDYSGHPFQVQLSRELARRGNDVLHLHCPSYQTGKGALEVRPDDPPTFRSEGVALRKAVAKYSLWKRPLQERELAKRLIQAVELFRPDVVVSANTPILAQAWFQRGCHRRGYSFVFWQQDLYTLPMKKVLEKRLRGGGKLIGRSLIWLEGALLRRSEAVVAISDDFLPMLAHWKVLPRKVHVIENWAPIEELPQRPKNNAWARKHALVGKDLLLYSGMLGIKHDERLLVRLAERFDADDDVRIVVITGDYGLDRLRSACRERQLRNLVLLNFQDYEDLPDVLGAADVLLVILDEEAAHFSVPSKVLTYLCAGRPVLAAIPRANLAARVIDRSRGGIICDPADEAAFADAAATLIHDRGRAAELGTSARGFAEDTFDIEAITDRFEVVLRQAIEDGAVEPRNEVVAASR